MAKSIMTQPSLFERLRQGRATLKAARADIEALRGSMSRKGEPVPGAGGWAPAEDLYIQLGNAVKLLDEAADVVTPLPEHLDQPACATRREVAHC
jgi:hypothetical protein